MCDIKMLVLKYHASFTLPKVYVHDNVKGLHVYYHLIVAKAFQVIK